MAQKNNDGNDPGVNSNDPGVDSGEPAVSGSTRRLQTSELPPLEEDESRTLDYTLPWVIELRIVGTSSVMQIQVKDELFIGRSDPQKRIHPQIDLESHNGYQMGVSRRHAVILLRENRLMLRDLNSANGTYLNGHRLATGVEYRIKHGDTLGIGKMQLQLLFAVMPSSADIERTTPVDFEIPKLGSGQRILLVDHDRSVAFVLASVLEQAGFRVQVVETYAAAMNVITAQMPHILITELMLPDVSGLQLVDVLRGHAEGEHVPTIVITAATAGYQMGQALEAGVDVFMCKPVGIDELMRGLGKILDSVPE